MSKGEVRQDLWFLVRSIENRFCAVFGARIVRKLKRAY